MKLRPSDFDRSARGFHAANASFLARCARCAYLDDPASELERRTGLGSVRPFRAWDSDAEGFFARGEGLAVLAFRGTESSADWMGNLDARLVAAAWAPGRVHAGFAGALDEAWPRIARRLGGLRGALASGEAGLWTAGHSLGGALAVLAAARLEAEGFRVSGVLTLGQPRLGDGEFVRAFAVPWVRVVNGGDAIPRLPFATRRRPWAHGGSLAWIDLDGRLHAGAGAEALRRERARGVRFDSVAAVEDHAVERYCDRLEALLDSRALALARRGRIAHRPNPA